jgi:hypothetical protein
MSFNRNFHFDASIPSRGINQSASPSKIWPGFGPQIDHLVGEAGEVALMHPFLIHGFGANRGNHINNAVLMLRCLSLGSEQSGFAFVL